MIRESQLELQSLMVTIHQGNWNVLQTIVQTTAGLAGPYELASLTAVENIDRILRVQVNFNDRSVPMRRLDWETDVLDEVSKPWDSCTDIRYRYVAYGQAGVTDAAAQMFFYPPPSAQHLVIITYIGTPGSLSLTDAVNTLGHDEYIVLDGMIKCLRMEESDTTAVERQKERYVARLNSDAAPLDMGQPEVIRDVRGADLSRGRWYP